MWCGVAWCDVCVCVCVCVCVWQCLWWWWLVKPLEHTPIYRSLTAMAVRKPLPSPRQVASVVLRWEGRAEAREPRVRRVPTMVTHTSRLLLGGGGGGAEGA